MSTPWDIDLVEKRLSLWCSRAHFGVASKREARQALLRIGADLGEVGVGSLAPLGGSASLVGKATLDDGTEVVVKVGPRTALDREVELYAQGSKRTPSVVASGHCGPLAWIAMTWAGTSPDPGTIAVDEVLNLVEDFQEASSALGVSDASTLELRRQEALLAASRAEDLRERVLTTSGPYDVRPWRSGLSNLSQAVLAVPALPRNIANIHGDVHEGNIVVEGLVTRLIDPKLLAGDLNIEVAYAAVALRDSSGRRLGRLSEVLQHATERAWYDETAAMSWVRWFAATRAVSWWHNVSGTEQEISYAIQVGCGHDVHFSPYPERAGG